jgi:hypothetical protein
MKSLTSLITLAALMVVAATMLFTFSVAAAPVVARLEITAEEVAEAGAWQDLAEAIGLPWGNLFTDANGEAVGKRESLPMPLVGQMYGGAWGTRGSDLKQVLPQGWRTWRKGANDDGKIPGVLAANTPDGVVVHAERGSGGEVFLFVGSQSGASGQEAADLAGLLQNAIDEKGSEGWKVFCDAVSKTPTGTSAARAEQAVVALSATQGYEVTAEGVLTKDGKPVKVATPKGGPVDTARGGKRDAQPPAATGGGIPAWVIWASGVVAAMGILWIIVAGLRRRPAADAAGDCGSEAGEGVLSDEESESDEGPGDGADTDTET